MARTAVIYVRQSRHKEYERTVSPEVQEKACRELGTVRGCSAVEVYSDLDVSGGKLSGRAGFLALLRRIEAGGVDVVAAYDQSRTFRNTSDALQFYALMERRPGVEVVFVHGRFDRTAAGEFTYTTLAAAHAMERRMAGEKIKASYQFLSSQGRAVGPLPFGLRREGRGPMARVTVDEGRADIVRRIFHEYATGSWSTRGLARRLTDEGVLAPGRNGWQADTLQDMLGNVAYIGMTYSVSRLRREGQLIPAVWDAIVDRPTWEAVQEQLRRNRRKGGGAGIGGEAAPYVFSRLLVCAECGKAMNCRSYYAHGEGDRARYYKCRNADAGGVCGSLSVREDRLLPWARSLFQRIDGATGAAVKDELDTARGRRRSPVDAVKRIDLRLERITELYALGHWDRDRYLAERARLHGERERLVAQSPAATLRLDGVLDAWDRGDARARRALLAALFDSLYVRNNRIVGWDVRRERAVEVERLLDAIGWEAAGAASA